MAMCICTPRRLRLMIWISIWGAFYQFYVMYKMSTSNDGGTAANSAGYSNPTGETEYSNPTEEEGNLNPAEESVSSNGMVSSDSNPDWKDHHVDYPKLDGDQYFRPYAVVSSVTVYSAYIDLRHGNMGSESSIRMMALAETSSHPDLYCRFLAMANDQSLLIKVTWYETPEPHGAPYAAYVLSCVIPYTIGDPVHQVTKVALCGNADKEKCDTVVIPISNYVIDIPNSTTTWFYPHPPRREHSVCVPTLFGRHYKEGHVIEFIEATTILGAEYFFFYVLSEDYEHYENVLRFYRSRGRVTVFIVKLLIDPHSESVWNYAQSLVVQDCLFRNAGHSRYVMFNDIDEYFTPYAADTWTELSNTYLWKEPNRAGYAIPTIYFRPFRDKRITRFEDPPITLKLSMAAADTDFHLTKCLIRPERVFDQGIHHVSRVIQHHYLVTKMNTSIGALHHFKKVGFGGTERKRLHEILHKKGFLTAYKKAVKIVSHYRTTRT